ncbi:MAG TPA: hypothetical protein VFA47_10380, partial [Candidatus Manganitrophaceae bacterium]|nr:hypothetical protein [Candidatus Manganitrophaceae bacterium]
MANDLVVLYEEPVPQAVPPEFEFVMVNEPLLRLKLHVPVNGVTEAALYEIALTPSVVSPIRFPVPKQVPLALLAEHFPPIMTHFAISIFVIDMKLRKFPSQFGQVGG